MFRGRNLAAALLVLGLAACGGSPPPVASYRPLRPIEKIPPNSGVDLPTDTSRVSDELKDSGLTFVARYYRDPTSHYPPLTAAEAQRLSALGLKIVTVYEFHSGSPWYFSYASGYWDAYNAWREAAAAGQPVASAIYFGVDFNANAAQMYQVHQYFYGVNAAFAALAHGKPGYRIGVYGSGAVCAAITGARLAQYSWLSNAHSWAGYDSYHGWNIRQHGPFAQLSFDHDADEVRGNDYGAFRLPNYVPQPTPTPVASTAPPQPTPVAAASPAESSPPEIESGLTSFMRSLSLF